MLSNKTLVDDEGKPKVPIEGMELGQCDLFQNSGIKQWRCKWQKQSIHGTDEAESENQSHS